jgi:hypothetical protein
MARVATADPHHRLADAHERPLEKHARANHASLLKILPGRHAHQSPKQVHEP